MNIRNMIDDYMDNGYEIRDAEAKVAQDILLLKIANSRFSNHITIKGGVVMHSISNDLRRATRDLDLDFIKYSLEDDSIKKFIETLNLVDDDIIISINDRIKELHHQDYNGKRVNIILSDKVGNQIKTKLDIGVHKLFDIDQDEYCFVFDVINKNANLLINSKEQIFVEKIKSLLKLGFRSTRYKDLFDFYYLINIAKMDKDKLMNCFNVLVFNDTSMRKNNVKGIISRLELTFNSKAYRNNLTDPKINWLDLDIDTAIKSVLNYLEALEPAYV